MKRTITVIVVLVLLLAALSAGLYNFTNNSLNQFDIKKDELIITIPQGSSLNQCLNILNENGLFKPSWFFGFYFRVYSEINDKHINAGSFRFTSKMDNRSILKSLFYGENLYIIKVTYPEGITLEKFAEITEKKSGIKKDSFMIFANSPEIINQYNIPAKTAEGYLMPDTYTFFYDVNLVTIVNRLLNEQIKIWNSKFEVQAKIMKMSKHEVITLASIIEAETPVADERKTVSGVYHNRLKKKMLLQADPTVAFILNGKEKLRKSDLRILHPYNTYLNHGLPPGPINSPSISSIEAALNPERHDFIYFVAKGDGSNGHNFSKTYNEHLKYVFQYKRNIKKR